MSRKQKKAAYKKLLNLFVFGFIALGVYLGFTGKLNVHVLNASPEDSPSDNYYTIDTNDKLTLDKVKEPKSKNVLFFTSSWCSSCKYTFSLIQQESAKYPNVTFYVVDLDSHRDLATEFGAGFVSEYVFEENGEYKMIKNLDNTELPNTLGLFSNSGLFAL